MPKATKTAKTTYTVRIEWPVTYYIDVDVQASSPAEAADLAFDEADATDAWDDQRSYDESGDNYIGRITAEGDRDDWRHPGQPIPAVHREPLRLDIPKATACRDAMLRAADLLDGTATPLARELRTLAAAMKA